VFVCATASGLAPQSSSAVNGSSQRGAASNPPSWHPGKLPALWISLQPLYIVPVFHWAFPASVHAPFSDPSHSSVSVQLDMVFRAWLMLLNGSIFRMRAEVAENSWVACRSLAAIMQALSRVGQIGYLGGGT